MLDLTWWLIRKSYWAIGVAPDTWNEIFEIKENLWKIESLPNSLKRIWILKYTLVLKMSKGLVILIKKSYQNDQKGV